MRDTSGREFEARVATYLSKSHGMRVCSRNEMVRGAATKRPWECDVHAVDGSFTGTFVAWTALIIGLIGLAAHFNTVPHDIPGLASLKNAIESQSPYLSGLGHACLGAVALAIAAIAALYREQHVWVECKDRNTSVKRADIAKLHASIQDVRNVAQPEWHPHEVWIASSALFDDDAVSLATNYGIRCFSSATGRMLEL